MCERRGEDLVVGNGRASGEPLVDGEHHASHVSFAIVRRDGVERERNVRHAEVPPGGGGGLGRLSLGGVRVDVDVDRRQGVDVESWSAWGVESSSGQKVV